MFSGLGFLEFRVVFRCLGFFNLLCLGLLRFLESLGLLVLKGL